MEGLSNHYGPRRGDGATELVHYQGPPWHPHPFLKLGLMEKEVPGAEQKVLQGSARQQLGSVPNTQPSAMGG